MSQSFYLKVEAVNLAYFVDDTEDLSTIRGGGLMLLDAPDEVEDLLKLRTTKVSRITDGASQAVFRFDADSLEAAHEIRDKLTADLREIVPGDNAMSKLGHATFVVDVFPISGNFLEDKEMLIALNRWRQMQQCRLAPPVWNDQEIKGRRPYCGIDLVRPAAEQRQVANENKQWVSRSVSDRSEYGRKMKQEFYRKRAPGSVPEGLLFARHFLEIGARPPEKHKQLRDKIAVIYIDGNKFGSQQRQIVKDETTQKKWDNDIQDFRTQLLVKLLERVKNDPPGWQLTDRRETVIRLETLLWGGDELKWVVPAWKGWETLRLFFDEAKAFYGPKSSSPPKRNTGKIRDLNAPRKIAKSPDARPRLTHAAGIVFCHADAPIQRVLAEAAQIVDQVKKKAENKDAFMYLVLESFDHLGAELDEARASHLPQECCNDDLVIPANRLRMLTEELQTMIHSFPRGSVYRILHALQSGIDGEAQKWIARAERDAGTLPTSFRMLKRKIDWLHLAELWDYVPEDG